MRPSCFKRLLLAVLLCGASTLSAVERAEYERLVAEFTPDRFARVEAASRIQIPVRDPGRATEPPLQILSSRNRLVLELGRELRAPSREEDCDDEAFASRTGAALVEHVRASPYACLNRLFVSAPGSIRFAAFRAQNMIDVATATQPLAAGYAGTNADNLAEFALFLRIGYYNFFYESEYMDWTGRVDEIDAAVVAAIDAFVENDHFHDDTDAHEDALWEVVTLMDSSEQQARYVPAAMSWLRRWAPRHLATELDGAVNQFFVMLFRGHHQPEFAPATADDTELMETLRDFALADWMLDTDAQYLAENAGRELGRFGQYRDAAIHPSVSSGVRTILERYDPYGEGRFVWIATATTITHYDDCASYGICGFRAELEAVTLPIAHTCSASTRVRAQNLAETELMTVCALLGTQETRFHRQLRTGGEAVADDFNSAVEVVVFADDAEYAAYSFVFFGNDTNNGGIYLEGDPGEQSNTARFLAYRATWLEGEPVWNLEHELVHYLDGRFNMQGGFGDYGVDSHNTVWWLEGLAEYASKANTDVTAVEVGRSAATRLSEAFEVTYNDNSTAVYRWSYLATRFMFERHRDDVDVFLRHFRAGDYDGYRDYLNDVIGTGYDAEWLAWLGDVAASDDEPRYLAELPSAMTLEEESTGTYRVALATRPTSEVTVTVQPSGNLTLDRTSFTFAAGDWDTAQTVRVTAPADDNVTHETAILSHVARGGGYDSARALVTVAISDNAPEVSFDTTSVSVREGGTATLTIRLERPLATATTLRYVLGTDDNPATGDADDDDHDGRAGVVTIPAGQTQAALAIAVHDDSDIEPAREVLAVELEIPPGQLLARGALTASVVIDEGVCDRTALIRDELRGSAHCADVTPADLADWYILNLERRDWAGPLQAGDLSGLTGTVEVRFNRNRLTALPETAFLGLHSLFSVLLQDNDLAELPPRLFHGTKLRYLSMQRNQLRALPAGVFSGLPNLTLLEVADNPGAPFPLRLEWARPDAGAGPDFATLVARLPVGAPFEIRARISATNGTLSADTVVVPAGATESARVIVTPTGAGGVRVAFDSVSPVPDDLCGAYGDFGGLPCFQGLETAIGEAVTVSLPRLPTELSPGDTLSLALSRLFRPDPAQMRTFSAVSSDPALASVTLEQGRLTIRSPDDAGSGTVTITVTAIGSDGTSTERILRIAVEPLPAGLLRGWRRALLEQLLAESPARPAAGP